MSRDSETLRQLCVALEAMTMERDEALIRAERAESINNDQIRIGQLENSLADCCTEDGLEQREKHYFDRATVIEERDQLRDGLITLLDEAFGLQPGSTPDRLLTAMKEGIRRLSREAEAIQNENQHLREAGKVTAEGPGCRVEAYVDGCASAPAVALYPNDHSNGRWTTLDRFLDVVSEEFPEELIAAAERLKATALLDASGEIDRHRPEPTDIVGKWVGDAIVNPHGSSCRMVSEEGDRFVEFKGGGAAVWEETTNVIAILERAGRLPMVLDKETLAKAALLDWSREGNRLVALDGKKGACAVTYATIQNSDAEFADNSVDLCEKLGIAVPAAPAAPAAHLSKNDASRLEAYDAMFAWTQARHHRNLWRHKNGSYYAAINNGCGICSGKTPADLAAKLGAK